VVAPLKSDGLIVIAITVYVNAIFIPPSTSQGTTTKDVRQYSNIKSYSPN